jgi:hypothetical protein
MKSDATKKPFPISSEEWEQLIFEALCEESTPGPEEEQAYLG